MNYTVYDDLTDSKVSKSFTCLRREYRPIFEFQKMQKPVYKTGYLMVPYRPVE